MSIIPKPFDLIAWFYTGDISFRFEYWGDEFFYIHVPKKHSWGEMSLERLNKISSDYFIEFVETEIDYVWSVAYDL